MIDKIDDLVIDEENPFSHDQLGREYIADNLEKIISSFNGSVVLSIDSGWGTGKTTFIKMWQKKLENSGKYQTLYFNSWENDDKDDPFFALIAEMEEILFKNEQTNPVVNNIKNFGKHLFKTGIPLILKIATHGLLDLNKIDFGENKDDILGFSEKIGEFELEDYKKEKESKTKFKEALVEYQKDKDKKIIFFIDELDRCRPTFAIETLEKIKHLFNIPNYIFVLSLDKKQLSYSIQTLYGQNIDSNGYLKRFIDIDYSLSEPDRDTYVDILLEKYQLKNDKTAVFELLLKRAIEVYKLSLRDIDKLIYFLKIIMPQTYFVNNNNAHPTYLMIWSVVYSVFTVLKIKKNYLYDKFIKKQYENIYVNGVWPRFDLFTPIGG